MSDIFAIDPFLHDHEYDQEEARKLHFDLFGHNPPTDPSEKCEHPIHAQIRREMNGAEHIIMFNPDDIISDDSVLQGMYEDRYEETYAKTKQWQGAIEEEIAWEERSSGIIVPGG